MKQKKMKYKEDFEFEYFKKPKQKSKPQKDFKRKDKINRDIEDIDEWNWK